MAILEEITAYCVENRVSTTEVSDALGKEGVFDHFSPLTEHQYAVGVIRCVFTANGSNFELHEQLQAIEPGEVVIVFTANCDNLAILGELVSKYVLLYKRASALVVQGMIRDRAALLRQGYKIWHQGFTPLGCVNEDRGAFPADQAQALRERFEGGLAVCDSGGVTVIERSRVTAKILGELELIEAQEDLWFYCLDTLKWSTQEIVCDRRYLHDGDNIPSILLRRVSHQGS